jgi:Na+/H+-translocating membrane pyrophosphatase
VDNPLIFSCLLVGAMLPYAFSAMTMKSVSHAAYLMVIEVRRQVSGKDVNSPDFIPDYDKCISVSTKASLKEMIAPGLLVPSPISFSPK